MISQCLEYHNDWVYFSFPYYIFFMFLQIFHSFIRHEFDISAWSTMCRILRGSLFSSWNTLIPVLSLLKLGSKMSFSTNLSSCNVFRIFVMSTMTSFESVPSVISQEHLHKRRFSKPRARSSLSELQVFVRWSIQAAYNPCTMVDASASSLSYDCTLTAWALQLYPLEQLAHSSVNYMLSQLITPTLPALSLMQRLNVGLTILGPSVRFSLKDFQNFVLSS